MIHSGSVQVKTAPFEAKICNVHFHIWLMFAESEVSVCRSWMKDFLLSVFTILVNTYQSSTSQTINMVTQLTTTFLMSALVGHATTYSSPEDSWLFLTFICTAVFRNSDSHSWEEPMAADCSHKSALITSVPVEIQARREARDYFLLGWQRYSNIKILATTEVLKLKLNSRF